MYTHLVISGGGVKGTAIIGALQVLYDNHLLDNLEALIGSSAGGLICFLLNIGFTHNELKDIMLNINFNDFREIDFSAVFKKWGLDSGDKFIKLVIAIIKQKNIEKDITFIELYQKTNKLLVITGSELTTNQAKYFNYKDTPNMKVLDAIRITISYPIIFQPFYIDNDDTNIREIYVDGALFSPYPIDYFKDIKNKIGIIIHSRHNENKIEDGEDYIVSMLKCFQERYEKFYLNNHLENSIIIDIKNIYSMNFNIDKDDKIKMYEIGQECTKTYLEKQQNK